MPRTARFTREQRRRLNDLLNGLGNANTILRGISDEVAQIFLTIDGEPTADDIAFMRRRIRDEIDNAYGATQARAKASPMYQALDDAIMDSVIGQYEDMYEEAKETVQAFSESAWERIDTTLRFGPDDGDVLQQVRKSFDLPDVAKRRAYKESLFDPNRRWVARQRGDGTDSYSLSQRVWKAGKQTRTDIDRILSDYTRGTYKGRNLYDELEQYLNPDKASTYMRRDGAIVQKRAGVRTPNQNYRIRRLLTTEMQRANYVTTVETAKALPGNAKLQYRLSNHPRRDIDGQCKPRAEGSSAGLPPGVYEISEFPPIPTHVLCRCSCVKFYVETAAERADAIIAKYLGRAEADTIMAA